MSDEKAVQIKCEHIESEGYHTHMAIRFGNGKVLLLCQLCASVVRLDVLKGFFK